MDLLKAAMSDFENVLRIDPQCHEARRELAIARELWEEGEGDETGFNTSEDEAPHPEANPDNDDSEDEHHIGRGAKLLVPCRFHNHDGCNKGAACDYSHAPDNRSLQDDLGRNVCMRHLIDSCKFGNTCVYAHTSEFLPDSGLSPSDQHDFISMSVQIYAGLPVMPLNAGRPRSDKKKAASSSMPPLETLPVRSGHVERRSSSPSMPTLEALPVHSGPVKKSNTSPGMPPLEALPVRSEHGKRRATSPTMPPLEALSLGSGHVEKQATSRVAPASASSPPFILLISFMDPDMFNGMHGHFMGALSSKADYAQATTSKDALNILSNRQVSAVYVTDPTMAAARTPHSALVAKLVEYVKGGGTVVFGGLFSGMIRPDDNDAFFKNVWGLGWKMGNYHRTDFVINPLTHPKFIRGLDVPELYNVKTVHLKGVAAQDVVYAPMDGSYTQSAVFAPQKVYASEVPVAYTQIGGGYLGYHGEVNGEDETTNIILSMLGVPERSPTSVAPKVEAHSNAQRPIASSSSAAVSNFPGQARAPKKKKPARPPARRLNRYQRDVLNVLFEGWDDDSDEEERIMRGDFTQGEMDELICQGIKPWEDDW
ncbi:hypothetical protein FIBSPDRAFT_242463 [Athelia psychrophila]|uniref:C3H1-type domain-containing protein n=1 Tax=Athelia psychrophila TaxID=1759441 RepID=A0A165Y5S0_9AGAM|nr:hypothetical protein FIBSPDRAFT_242463 [Fibularhizoctonia sp. CBS 109695]